MCIGVSNVWKQYYILFLWKKHIGKSGRKYADQCSLFIVLYTFGRSIKNIPILKESTPIGNWGGGGGEKS